MKNHTTTIPTSKDSKPKGGRFLPALCGILGTLILVAVIAVSAPLTVPRLLGYEMYQVLSGSMEPAIPVGSVIYVKQSVPEEIQAGEIIAFFREEGDVVTHRVVDNHTVERELITKGDANEIQDFQPVPYNALIGRVERHIPVVGSFMGLLAGNIGKAYLLCLTACGVMFNILAGRLRRRNHERELIAESAFLREMTLQELGVKTEDQSEREREKSKTGHGRKKRKRKRVLRGVLMGLMLAVFCASAAQVLFIRHQYKIGEELYDAAAAQFTASSEPVGFEVPEQERASQAQPEPRRIPELAPIQVDFKSLKEINPDVTGWIYCPGTVINYPVLHGKTNDDYLHRSYDKSYNVSGSIFIEETNERDLSDCNYIIYGHHMGDRSMFATLDRWQEQGYFDEHPIMWLLTPEQDYKVSLYSAYTVSAYDKVYSVFHARNAEFDHWLEKSKIDSVVESELELDPDAHYVMLSTCAYVFENARSVVHGQLQPASSAGGAALTDAAAKP